MSWAVWARVIPAVALLPLGSWIVRLLLGSVLALVLARHVSVEELSGLGLIGEVALGATLGLIAGLPAHAAMSIRGTGPEALGFAGRVWSWAIFFSIGGPALWLIGLASSFRALPAGAWPNLEVVISAGGALFYAALMLGLPTWLTGVVLAPLAGWIDRVDNLGWGARGLTVLRPIVTLLILMALLPVLLDVMRELWIAGLTGG